LPELATYRQLRPGLRTGGFSLFAIALIGIGLGAIIRNTAGAVAALPALIYLPLVVLGLPHPFNDTIGRFTLLRVATSPPMACSPRTSRDQNPSRHSPPRPPITAHHEGAGQALIEQAAGAQPDADEQRT
jgi:hypothetical protein